MSQRYKLAIEKPGGLRKILQVIETTTWTVSQGQKTVTAWLPLTWTLAIPLVTPPP